MAEALQSPTGSGATPAGRIRLELTEKLAAPPRAFAPHTLWVEMHEPAGGRAARLCFDMGDGGDITSMDALERCDFYFKRSCSGSVNRMLPARLGRKVRPYGLNYACISRNEPSMLWRLFKEWRVSCRGHATSLDVDPTAFRRGLQLTLVHTPVAGSRLCPYMGSETFEVPPDRPAELKVLFQTRLWNGLNSPMEWQEMNEVRADMVRGLRRTFGDRFVGGLEDTPLARQLYPDLISALSCQKRDYLALVRRHLIAVTSTGLFDSIGWKLPEYLAASRCIVAEPPRYQLPTPLEPGVHYVPVATAEATVAACDQLLSDPELARDMREANFRYYLEHVRPQSLLWNCLQVARLESLRSAGATGAGETRRLG